MRVWPSAMAAIMAYRCEMDLSPGNPISPETEVAGAIFLCMRIPFYAGRTARTLKLEPGATGLRLLSARRAHDQWLAWSKPAEGQRLAYDADRESGGLGKSGEF